MTTKYTIENDTVYLDNGWPVKWQKPEDENAQIPLEKLTWFIRTLEENPQMVSMADTYKLMDDRNIGSIEFPEEFSQEDIWAIGRYLNACLVPSKEFVQLHKQLSVLVNKT